MKKLFLFFLVLAPALIFSQINPKTKWGKVSDAEIEYNKVPYDEEAGAVILYESGNAYFTNALVIEIHKRIKILNERGLEFANQDIVYYSGNDAEKIFSVEAQTINIENGKTVVTPVSKKDIYTIELNSLYSSRRFAFPNVKPGSIIEFKYVYLKDNLDFFNAWTFQNPIPTLYSSFEMDRSAGWYYKLDFEIIAKGERLQEIVKRGKKIKVWKLKDLPGLGSSKFTYNPADNSERLMFRLKEQQQIKGRYIHIKSFQKAYQSWTHLNNTIFKRMNEMRNDSLTSAIVSQIPNGSNEKETLQNIVDFFKVNYQWSNYRAALPARTNLEVVESGFGNTADLNLLMNSVLIGKKIKSDLVFISTRDNGKVFRDFPYLGQFNGLVNIATLNGNESYLIDAADMTYDLGFAPLDDYNYVGLAINNFTGERFLLLEPPISNYYSAQNYIFKDGKYLLTKNEKRSGYFKKVNEDLEEEDEISDFFDLTVDLMTEEIRKDFKEADENNYEIERTVYETEELSEKVFIPLENPMKRTLNSFRLIEEERDPPLEYNMPFYLNSIVNVDIPSGYKVEIPADYNKRNHLKNDEIVYLQNAEINGNKIVLKFEFLLGKSIFLENYHEIKSLFDQAISDVEKVILLRKE